MTTGNMKNIRAHIKLVICIKRTSISIQVIWQWITVDAPENSINRRWNAMRSDYFQRGRGDPDCLSSDRVDEGYTYQMKSLFSLRQTLVYVFYLKYLIDGGNRRVTAEETIPSATDKGNQRVIGKTGESARKTLDYRSYPVHRLANQRYKGTPTLSQDA